MKGGVEGHDGPSAAGMLWSVIFAALLEESCLI